MEEVDGIIIHSLRQVGCDVEDDVDSLKQFSTELVIEAAVRCLDVIQPGLGLPHSLPDSMSARFRVGASIAQACKNLGYSGDIGYQTFLYSSEIDIRRVFVFLIEKLPKESGKSIVEPTGRIGVLEKAVSETVKKQLASPWLPRYCRRRGIRWYDDGTWSREGCGHNQPFISCNIDVPKTANSRGLSQAWREYYVHHLPLVTEQVPHIHQLLPSLITLNAKGLLTPVQPVHGAISNWDTCKINQQLTDCIARSFDGCSSAPEKESSVAALHIQDNDKKRRKETNSRFALSERLQFTKESNKDKKLQESDEQPFKSQVVMGAEKKRGKEEEMQIAKGEMERLKECLEALQLDVKKLTTKLSQITEEKSHEIRVLKNKEQQQIVKKQTYDLLPEADTNLSALQTSVESSAQTLVLLAAQWEKHRAPLLAQYRDARERNSNKASESQKKVDALRNLREKSRELGEEVRHKEQLHSQLVTEYEKVTKDINRSAYTRRIMEIIGNISKQKEEIDKVLKDTKDLQKEINNLTGQLDRSFTVADELIFRDAKRDETARRAYKLLATLHSDCSELVQMVEETGATVREIRDLEEQIETERAKNVGANLDRISADLRQMKQETAALTAQLNAKS
ncbi:Coiled-coil domain-containing protein 22-like protein [Cryptotermes secundus]|uniref:Coiled-coil domain-containing protein 22 homolog n=1 Tax=Cryptotermes secundus TaxID=105785 RepID=A0A2J7RHQ6_9NEOP|nr:coiled-coil domain-containing protein 22 homolog [Cryptotermes secundus]PNF40363.1 Coiled-coil domain-containing protein 22-like protein [Cryptotermes secundus]